MLMVVVLEDVGFIVIDAHDGASGLKNLTIGSAHRFARY
jgi:hypothetical protein